MQSLIDEWIGDAEVIPVLDIASVSLVREEVRARGAARGLDETSIGALVIVASELAHNQLAHARGGVIGFQECAHGGVAGLEVIAADRGDGIRDPAAALRGRTRATGSPEDQSPRALPYHSQGSLGIGLAAVMELADEVDVDVRIGEGTCIRARKLAAAVEHRRSVGIFGTAHPDERISGDHAAFVRTGEAGDALMVALADGLGHGERAREAANAAIASARENAALPPREILVRAHAPLAGTRGAVMAVVDVLRDALHMASVGNVSVRVHGPRDVRSFSGSSFVLGTPGPLRSIASEDARLERWDALVLFSDGLSHRASFDGDLDLLREPPIVIAQRLHERFARGNDDALVLVAR